MKRTALILTSFVIFLSCELVIPLESPSVEQKIVLNGLFHPDSIFTVSLTRPESILSSNEFSPITNAQVQLFADNQPLGQMILVDSLDSNGTYALNESPIPGVVYRIEASAPGLEPVSAESMIPLPKPFFLSINGFTSNESDIGFQRRKLDLTISDSPGEDQYEIELFVRSFVPVILADTLAGLSQTEQPIIFQSSSPLFDNITGSFTGRVFNDELFDGTTYSFTLDFSFGTAYTDEQGGVFELPEKYFIIFKVLSTEYFQYFRTAGLQRDLENNPFVEPIRIYSNVENGYGIFAGYQSYQIPIN